MQNLNQKLEEAISLHGQGKVLKAVALYQEILDTDAKNIGALQYLGVARLQTGDSEDGIRLLRRAISFDPKNSEAHYNLGLAWRSKGNNQKALASLRRSIAIQPRNFEAQNAIAGILLEYRANLKYAEAHIRTALKHNPKYAPALNNLALLLQKRGLIEDATVESRKAVALNPQDGSIRNTLGAMLLELGKVEEAEKELREATGLMPRDADALRNLAFVLNLRNKPLEAKKVLVSALKYSPKDAKCLNNLAMIHADEGHLKEAVNILQQTIETNPSDAVASSNLGKIFLRQKKWVQAVDCFRKAFDIEPSDLARAQDFVDSLGKANLSDPGSTFIKEVERCFKIDGLNCEPLIPMTVRYISGLKNVCSLIKEARSGELNISATELQKAKRLEPLCCNLVFRVLEQHIIPVPSFEILLTEIRRNLLELAVAGRLPEKLSDKTFKFLCALASHCYLNEYVYMLSGSEEEMLNSLSGQLSDRIFQVDDTLPRAAITVFACYKTIVSLKGCELLEKHELANNDKAFSDLITLQVRCTATEQNLKSSLSDTGVSADSISLKVRDQYEHSPYPRWFHISRPKSRALLAVLWDKFPNSVHSGVAISDTPKILVAGCGTGLLAIDTALRYRNANIIALDLSLNSLAYGKRKSLELAVDQVEWTRGDILALKGSDMRFDMIDCSGVLHHMDNPLEGWKILRDLLKPGGVMRVGLYSKSARADFAQTSRDISVTSEVEWQSQIRRFRRTIFDLPDDKPIKRTIFLRDFYTLSECRDLLFHTKEHHFTLLEIQKHLGILDLDFMGFDLPDDSILGNYHDAFPDDPHALNLINWHQFETSEPHLFVGMYQFWVKQTNKLISA